MDSRKPLTAGEIEELRRIAALEEPTLHDLAEVASQLDRIVDALTPPPDAAVREAVEHLSSGWGESAAASRFKGHVYTLIRAAQAQRLTPEQMEAVKLAETLITDTMSDYGDCEHDVGHCICKYHSGVFNLRAAFPEVFAGEATEVKP